MKKKKLFAEKTKFVCIGKIIFVLVKIHCLCVRAHASMQGLTECAEARAGRARERHAYVLVRAVRVDGQEGGGLVEGGGGGGQAVGRGHAVRAPPLALLKRAARDVIRKCRRRRGGIEQRSTRISCRRQQSASAE